MTPQEIIARRKEIGLTVAEMAFALNIPAEEMLRIEAGESDYHRCAEFEEAFAVLEARVFGLFVGA
jgi:hypothetical protein